MYYKVSSGPIGCNLLTILLVVILAVNFPGILWVLVPIALVILIPIALVAFRFARAMWKIKRAYKKAYENTAHTHRQRESKASAGDVKIILTDQAEQRVNNDVGEYVDFQEIKENKTK